MASSPPPSLLSPSPESGQREDSNTSGTGMDSKDWTAMAIQRVHIHSHTQGTCNCTKGCAWIEIPKSGGGRDHVLPKKLKDDETDWREATKMITQEYYDLFENDEYSALNTTVPIDELFRPGTVKLNEKNIHLTPFGCSLIEWDGEKMKNLDRELIRLKKDAGLRDAKLSLEVPVSVNINYCVVCGEKANSKCRDCLAVAYCSREHQKAHWKEHRPHCVLHEVVQDPVDGAYVIAKYNIKKGEAILIEEPYLITPFSADEHFNLLKFQPISSENRQMPVGKYTLEQYRSNVCCLPPVCLGCSLYLQVNGFVPCIDCGWPTCSEKCSQLKFHRNLECSYFKQNNLVYQECYQVALLAPRIFGIMRGLLLSRAEPQQWNILKDKVGDEIWKEKMKVDLKFRMNTEYFLVILKKVFKFKDATYAEISDILQVIEMKGIYGGMCDPKTERIRRHTCVYQTASLIRHRCVGNVIAVQTHPVAIHVIAAKAIKKGEILYRNHDRNGELLHGLHRQRFALSLTNMLCDCSFCVDASEDEKCFSALTCLKCKRRGFESYMNCVNTGTVDSPWKCQRCASVKTIAQVQKLLNDAIKDLDCSEPDPEPFYMELKLRRALSKYKGHVLHTGHAVILAAECNVIFLMMERIDFLNDEELETLSQLLTSRIHNLSRFVPDIDSSLVSMKIRMAVVLAQRTCRTPLLRQNDMLKSFSDLQRIYNDIANCFVENSKKNVVQGYLLLCLRNIRNIMAEVGILYNGHRRFLKRSLKLPKSYVEEFPVESIEKED